VKRSAPLRRSSPLRRRARVRTRRPSSYRRRERDFEFMAWVRRQPCIVRTLPPDPNRLTPCGGRVEADHFGSRGLSRKGHDRTCVPMCTQHHRERSDHHGAFFKLNQLQLREWRGRALELVASWPGAPAPLVDTEAANA